MAQDLSFLEYKNILSKNYNNRKKNGSKAPKVVFENLNDTDFYRLSFYDRTNAELEYQILDMLLKTDELNQNEELKKRTEYYLESCAQFLLRDAEIADNTAEAKIYRDKLEAFNAERLLRNPHIDHKAPVSQSEFQKSWNLFCNDVSDYLSTPFHISKCVTVLSYLNLYRLLSAFSRLSYRAFWTVAQQNQWIDAQNTFNGHPIDRNILETSADLFNFLSVSLFAARLAAHASMIWKHARSQREGEKDIPVKDRVWLEFYTRMSHVMNDLVWMVINLLTNYASFWRIADPVANTLLACTLVYDSIWLATQWRAKTLEWQSKHDEIASTLKIPKLPNLLNKPGANSINLMEDHQLNTLKLKMLADLKFEMHVKFAYSILAGLSIMSSYLLVLALASTAFSVVGFMACVVGFGMYASAGEFGTWMRAKFGAMKIADEEQTARTQYFQSFAKATFTPLIMVGLVTVSWPAAVLAMAFVTLRPYIPKCEIFASPENQTPALVM